MVLKIKHFVENHRFIYFIHFLNFHNSGNGYRKFLTNNRSSHKNHSLRVKKDEI